MLGSRWMLNVVEGEFTKETVAYERQILRDIAMPGVRQARSVSRYSLAYQF